MVRLLLFAVLAFIVYRVLRSLFLPPPVPRTNPGQAPTRPRRHGIDLSKVQEAEFEDITPPSPSHGEPAARDTR